MLPKTRDGHVMRGIRRAFIVEPGRAWSTSELREWTHALAGYQGKNSRRERHYHCWDIRRACERLCVPVGRGWWQRTTDPVAIAQH
jgi:hypothetical protein